MSEGRIDFSNGELEQALFSLGKEMSYPTVPDLVTLVGTHLRQHPRSTRAFPLLPIRRLTLYPLVMAVGAIVLALAISSGARTTVASWFHIPGVRIESGVSPGPLGHNLALGSRTTLVDAQKRLRFHILVPAERGFRKPDEVYVGTPPTAESVSLLYRARPGVPRAATTGAGLLIGESPENLYVGKMIPNAAILERVTVRGAPGFWIGGAHFVYYLDTRGQERRDTIRLAGNTLLWESKSVTFRIEGRISKQRALEIARSMEAAASHH